MFKMNYFSVMFTLNSFHFRKTEEESQNHEKRNIPF